MAGRKGGMEEGGWGRKERVMEEEETAGKEVTKMQSHFSSFNFSVKIILTPFEDQFVLSESPVEEVGLVV